MKTPVQKVVEDLKRAGWPVLKGEYEKWDEYQLEVLKKVYDAGFAAGVFEKTKSFRIYFTEEFNATINSDRTILRGE